MQKKKIRLVVDTNLWISFLIGKTITSSFNRFLEDDRFEILSCTDLSNEISGVLSRPKFKKYISSEQILIFKKVFIAATTNIEIKSHLKISSDTGDNFLLSLSKDGDAHFLITGDKMHLLNLVKFEKTDIISFSDFYKRFFQE